MTTDKNTLDLAREWAADIDADRQTLSQDTIDAAADLISSLPDAWVDADTLREVIDKWEDRTITSDAHLLYREVEALLPTPPAPESSSPRPEDVPVGEPWQVDANGQTAIGFRNDPSDTWPWSVTYQDWPEVEYLHDSDVTLIARLVPETTEQEPEFDPAYTYRDRGGRTWESPAASGSKPTPPVNAKNDALAAPDSKPHPPNGAPTPESRTPSDQ